MLKNIQPMWTTIRFLLNRFGQRRVSEFSQYENVRTLPVGLVRCRRRPRTEFEKLFSQTLADNFRSN